MNNPILQSILNNANKNKPIIKKPIIQEAPRDEDYDIKDAIKEIIEQKPSIKKVREFYKDYINLLEDEYSESD